MEQDEADLIRLLKAQDEAVFSQVFISYFRQLRKYAFTFVREQQLAEDIVQTVFHRLWERPAALSFSGSIAAYLYRAVHHESLNVLKHNKVKRKYQSWLVRREKEVADPIHRKIHPDELEQRLKAAINQLPEQCRTIFQMSRFEQLRYRDIGLRLGISVKTVENQMGKALRILRTKLVDLLPLLLLYLLNS